jgi:hypothetical protein
LWRIVTHDDDHGIDDDDDDDDDDDGCGGNFYGYLVAAVAGTFRVYIN